MVSNIAKENRILSYVYKTEGEKSKMHSFFKEEVSVFTTSLHILTAGYATFRQDLNYKTLNTFLKLHYLCKGRKSETY